MIGYPQSQQQREIVHIDFRILKVPAKTAFSTNFFLLLSILFQQLQCILLTLAATILNKNYLVILIRIKL